MVWLFWNAFLIAFNMALVGSLGSRRHVPDDELQNNLMERVFVTETSFIIMSCLFAWYVFRITSLAHANSMLQSKNTSVKELIVIGVSIPLTFVSRAVYNFVAVFVSPISPWDYSYRGSSGIPESDFEASNFYRYRYVFIFFAMVLWELAPCFLILYLFRVSRPKSAGN